MSVRGLSEEQRDQVIEGMIKLLGVERKHLSKKELEQEIIEYLGKKQPCVLATCGSDGMPRASVVDYMNEGLTLYIMSEGGQKFENIGHNKHVSIGIGSRAKKMRSVRGVNIWGTAEIFGHDTSEFKKGLTLFRPFLEDVEQLAGRPVQIPPGALHLIRIIPDRMVYHHYNKGIGNALWEA